MFTGELSPIRRSFIVLMAVLALSLVGCSGSGDDSSGGSGGAEEPAGSGVVDEEAAAADLEVGGIIQLHYVHEGDSGEHENPWGDAEVRLLFEPGDQFAFFVADGENGLGRHGTYEYAGGSLALSLESDEVSIDAELDLDVGAVTVEMPFQAFSSEPGTSTWRREVVGPMGGTDYVFQAIRYDDAAGIPREDAVVRAHEYAAARVETDAAGFGDVDLGALGAETEAEDTGGDEEQGMGPRRRGMTAEPAGGTRVRLTSTRPDTGVPPGLADTEPFDSGVTLVFEDGSRATVLLYSWAPDTARDTIHLSSAPFAGDPRVELPTETPGVADADPASKVAVLASPFATAFGELETMVAAGRTLEGRGYELRSLYDDEVTFESLVEALTDGSTPGFFGLSTHGGASGAMATAEELGSPISLIAEWQARRWMRPVEERIEAAFPGAKDYEVEGVVRQPYEPLLLSTSAGRPMVYVGLSPTFWRWLHEEQGADFSDSFVMLSACESDKNRRIREDVDAEVFVGFSEQASVSGATAAFAYLVEQLARPTRSMEEAHYNLVRVINTQQAIFKEDALLDGTPTTDLPDMLEVYSGGGYNPVSYEGRGFLDTTHDLGQIWWLTYSGRWSGDAAEGAQKLQNCWDQFWAGGNKGGLASPACNASNTGSLPTEDEVGYAKYLLTGDDSGVQGTSVPRWTLADGG